MAELHEAQKLLGKAMNIMYKNPNDGNDVDLLSITGVKQKMNLYVTSLIHIVFTREELLQIDATKIKFNDGSCSAAYDKKSGRCCGTPMDPWCCAWTDSCVTPTRSCRPSARR
ncbi:unnamed protein product [Rotaria sordida]|uniref:Uncharacterized protein n=1 Tax=Rotaria sordida TaxID=392033 RepID=A0A814EZP4_9BILA|nr:unnamed protein product [Rotaria sordida]CAF1044236.1 unnamed protein product [Rotaria sordida]